MRIFSRPAQRYTWGALAAVAVCSLGVCEEKEHSSCSLSTLLSTCSTLVRDATQQLHLQVLGHRARERARVREREKGSERERLRERERERIRERTDAGG
jgi:hypothetical protein